MRSSQIPVNNESHAGEGIFMSRASSVLENNRIEYDSLDDYWIAREEDTRLELDRDSTLPLAIAHPDEVIRKTDEDLHMLYAIKLDEVDEDEALRIAQQSPYAHLRFLIRKRLFAVRQKKLLEPRLEEAPQELHEQSVIGNAINITKIGIGIIDDAWGALRNVLNARVIAKFGPFVVSTVGIIVHAFEFQHAAKDFYHTVQTKERSLRKTKLVTDAAIMLLGLGGLQLSAAYALYGLGIAFTSAVFATAMPLLPVIVPALLVGVYTAYLYRHSFALYRAHKHESVAKEDYLQYLAQQTAHLHDLKSESAHLRTQKHELLPEVNKILQKLRGEEPLSVAENQQLDLYKDFIGREEACDNRYHELQSEIIKRKQIWNAKRDQRLEAERELSYSIIDVATSSAMVVGTILGASLILGAATVASFGMAPLIISISVVVIGIAIKVFEKIDEKNDHKFSKGIRQGFKALWNKLTSHEEQPEPRLSSQQQAPTPSSRSSTAHIFTHPVGTTFKRRSHRIIEGIAPVDAQKAAMTGAVSEKKSALATDFIVEPKEHPTVRSKSS